MIEPYIEYFKLKLIINYNNLHNYTHVIYSMYGSILDKTFGEKVSLTIKLPQGELDKFKARFPMTKINHFSYI